MDVNAPILLEGNEMLVEQRVDVRREQNTIVAAEPLRVRCRPPRFDVTGDQNALVCDAGDAACAIEKDHSLSEQSLAHASFRELNLLRFRNGCVTLYAMDVVEDVRIRSAFKPVF